MAIFKFARFAAVLPFCLLLVSCAEPKAVQLSVGSATITRTVDGRAAIDVTLSEKDAHNFAVFTMSAFGCVIEISAFGKVLYRPHLRSPILGGHLLIAVSSDPATGGLTDNNAAEIASRLASRGQKLDVRVVDQGHGCGADQNGGR